MVAQRVSHIKIGEDVTLATRNHGERNHGVELREVADKFRQTLVRCTTHGERPRFVDKQQQPNP